MDKLPFTLDEKTRISLTFNNFWAILVSVVLFVFSSAMVYYQHLMLSDKVDRVLVSQKEMKEELKDWKKQTEIRLGAEESDTTTVVNIIEQAFKIKITRAIRNY